MCDQGALRFADGKIMYWRFEEGWGFETLYETMAGSWKMWNARCDCGRDEPVELYLYSETWSGRACRHCRCITDFGGFNGPRPDGQEPNLRNSRMGDPDWLSWDANIEPTVGGEAAPTLAFWKGFIDAIGDVYCLPGVYALRDMRHDLHDLHMASAMNARELRQALDRIERLETDGVTPDAKVHVDHWRELLLQLVALHTSLNHEAKAIRKAQKNSPAYTRNKEGLDWLSKVLDAILQRSEPPPPPWDPALDEQIETLEKQFAARRDQLINELKDLESRTKELFEESLILCARMKLQHKLEFPLLRFRAK